MDYEKKYKEALEKAKRLYGEGTITESLCHIFPELKESKGERIRKCIVAVVCAAIWNSEFSTSKDECLAWLEKQETSYTKRDVEDAYIEGVVSTKNELEKQSEHDGIVEKAKNEKQRVLLTETNGNASIDWDTRSLVDTKLLLEYGLDFINKEIGKARRTTTL